jgi:hypothetical protein
VHALNRHIGQLFMYDSGGYDESIFFVRTF